MRRTTRRDFLQEVGQAGLGVLATSAVLRGAAPGEPAKSTKLNFLFILIDDMGWADLSCYGSTYHESPVIDRLAAQGMKFTDAYAAGPVCSPTRASILAGKYPARLHLTDFIPGHLRGWAKLIPAKIRHQLPAEETTIPEALQPAGYVSGCFGKWHLGGRQFGPTTQGFDVLGAGGRNLRDKRVTALTDQAIAFVGKNRDKPFFAYLSHHSVHIPLEAPRELVEKYQARLKPGQKFPQQANPTYAAMIEHLDKHVGRVLKELDDLGLAGRTVVIFFSDNGGLKRIYTGRGQIVTSNAPLRDEKGSLYEGGIRVPLIVRWPGVVKPGSVCRTPVTSVDFLPTILEMAGTKANADPSVDGVSLVPLLKQSAPPRRDAIYWHYPHYHHTAPCGAVRAGDYKLIEYFEDGRLELYNLKDDISEKNDLARKLPDKAADLRKKLDAWRKSVGALMPTPNPNHDPARAHEWGRRTRPKPKPKKPKP